MATFLTAKWESLIMVNYAVDPEFLKPYLPAGTELDLYDNNAWISLVGFIFRDTKIFSVPIPVFGTFEEVNLRFYVLRKENNSIKRGVVFLSEVVPHKPVVWLANLLYKEHYEYLPCRHTIRDFSEEKTVRYEWQKAGDWNSIKVNAQQALSEMPVGSFEEFIFEHYYGYTRIDSHNTEEYKVDHPRWKVNKVESFEINCNFEKMYGKAFTGLQDKKPDAVFLAEGSSVSVDWKRRKVGI